jgi:micrococcal nuclease
VTNAGGPSRDYDLLIPWWSQRAQLVDDYRGVGIAAGVLSVRLDYEEICEAAENNEPKTVFSDLLGGISKWTGGGALVYAGSVQHKFNLWIPNADSDSATRIIQLIEKRYTGQKRGYLYVSGTLEMYSGKPEIVLTHVDQLSDFPG